MEARFEVREEVLVVELKGRLDFETAEPFRRTVQQQLVRKKVVFDLRALSFVGSLGLKDFVDTMDHMARAGGVRVCGVSSEFRRLFEASGLSGGYHFFESRDQAVASLKAPAAPNSL